MQQNTFHLRIQEILLKQLEDYWRFLDIAVHYFATLITTLPDLFLRILRILRKLHRIIVHFTIFFGNILLFIITVIDSLRLSYQFLLLLDKRGLYEIYRNRWETSKIL